MHASSFHIITLNKIISTFCVEQLPLRRWDQTGQDSLTLSLVGVQRTSVKCFADSFGFGYEKLSKFLNC